MSNIILFSYYRSSTSFRVRIALNLKKISYRQKAVDLLKDEQKDFEYSILNPGLCVPTLIHGKRVITQSMAILEYLEDEFPEVKLLPEDSYKRALVRSFSNVIACDLHPLNNLKVLNYVKKMFPEGDYQKMVWYKHWMSSGLTTLEKMLKMQDPKMKYCFGDEPSFADICLIPQIYNALRYECNVKHFPRLMKVYERCKKNRFFKDAFPENQPDAIKN